MTESTELVERIETDIVKFAVTDEAIAGLRDACSALKIKGIDDKEGYVAVKEARTNVRSIRSQVEVKRKELKADALTYGRAIDGEAKRITALLLEIEGPLDESKGNIDDAKKAIREEKARAAAEVLDARAHAMAQAGSIMPISRIKDLSDAEYASALAAAIEAHKAAVTAEAEAAQKAADAEQARLLESENRRAAEQAELAEARKEMDAERARLQKEQAEWRDKQRAKAEKAERAAAKPVVAPTPAPEPPTPAPTPGPRPAAHLSAPQAVELKKFSTIIRTVVTPPCGEAINTLMSEMTARWADEIDALVKEYS